MVDIAETNELISNGKLIFLRIFHNWSQKNTNGKIKKKVNIIHKTMLINFVVLSVQGTIDALQNLNIVEFINGLKFVFKKLELFDLFLWIFHILPFSLIALITEWTC